MRTAQWKQVERSIATLLGGQRVPVSGRGRGSAPDVEHTVLSLEIKHRKALPIFLHDAMQQAFAANKDGTKANVVILHEHGQRYDESFVMMPLHDLVDLIGRIP